MDSRDLDELEACIERVHATKDTSHTLADGMAARFLDAWRDWDGEDTHSSMLIGIFGFYRYLAAHEPTDMRIAVMALTPCLLYDAMPLPPDMLSILADCCVCEAELLRRDARDSPDPALAERAELAWQRVVDATDDDHPRHKERQLAHSRAVSLVAARNGDTAAIDRFVAAAGEGLASPGHPNRPDTLWDLHDLLVERYEATGNVADHEAALECAEELITYVSAGHPDAAHFAFSLGEKLYQRFLREPNTPDLRRAIGFLQEAVSVSDPDRPTWLLVLSRALAMGSAVAKDPDIANEAIARAEQADVLIQRNHKEYPLIKWQLASLHFQRYKQTYSDDDLDQAVAAVVEAGMCLPRELGLTALSAEIEFAQYQRTGNSEYLYRVLTRRERVVRKLPDGDSSRADALYQLGQIQMHWYRRMGSIGDLDDAIANGHAAIDLLAAADARRPRFLSGLGHIYLTSFSCRLERDHLPKAIDLFRDSVANEPDHYARLASLAMALGERYRLTSEVADLDEAIALDERALELTPARDRPDVLLDLSIAHRLRFGRNNDATDLHRARAAITEALALPALSLRKQMQLRLEQAELLAHPAEKLSAFEAAIDLLPQISLSRHYYEDREFALFVHAGLGAKAADVAVAAGRPDRALELLERARGILADAIYGISAPAARDLCRNTARGPIVTVSANETGGLALLVTPSGVHPVRLPALTLDDARACHRTLQRALVSQNRQDILEVLAWLWHAAARPVIETLAATGWDGSRLWWCPVGVLTLLPLHAAGDGPDSVMVRTVSSYLPTVRALASPRPAPAQPGNALAVAMSRTPGETSLLGAASEAHNLARLFGAAILHNESATREAVISALPNNRIVHFACHAQTDTREPVRSRLLLHDQALTPTDLLGLRLDADLAYLSACATSDADLISADEAMHLTSTFHLLGFRHVIGTLWPVDDQAAADIADRFYSLVADHGPSYAPYALNTAALELRHDHPDKPDIWASHLHVGP
jgi:CHAT domain-containing protein